MEWINQFLGIPKKDIGYFSDSKNKLTGIIDIAVMQSLVKKDTADEYIKDYGVDEKVPVLSCVYKRWLKGIQNSVVCF